MEKNQKGYVIYCNKSKQHYWCTSQLPLRSFEDLLENKITWLKAKKLFPKIENESYDFTIVI